MKMYDPDLPVDRSKLVRLLDGYATGDPLARLIEEGMFPIEAPAPDPIPDNGRVKITLDTPEGVIRVHRGGTHSDPAAAWQGSWWAGSPQQNGDDTSQPNGDNPFFIDSVLKMDAEGKLQHHGNTPEPAGINPYTTDPAVRFPFSEELNFGFFGDLSGWRVHPTPDGTQVTATLEETVESPDQPVLGRGLVSYSHTELEELLGLPGKIRVIVTDDLIDEIDIMLEGPDLPAFVEGQMPEQLDFDGMHKVGRLEAEIARLITSEFAVIQKLGSVMERVAELETDNRLLNETLAKSRANCKERVDRLTTQVGKLDHENFDLRQQYPEAAVRRSGLVQETEALKSQNEGLGHDVRILREQRSSLEVKLVSANSEIVRLQDQINQAPPWWHRRLV